MILRCKREDNYLIDTFELCRCPRVGEIVVVEETFVDEDGTWYGLFGYRDNQNTYDANCFEPLTNQELYSLVKENELVK